MEDAGAGPGTGLAISLLGSAAAEGCPFASAPVILLQLSNLAFKPGVCHLSAQHKYRSGPTISRQGRKVECPQKMIRLLDGPIKGSG